MKIREDKCLEGKQFRLVRRYHVRKNVEGLVMQGI
jgi:hypothetical protein